MTSDSLLSGISQKGLTMDTHFKIQNFPGGTTKTILNEVQELIESKRGSLIMHEGTNDFGKDKNVSFVIIINGF